MMTLLTDYVTLRPVLVITAGGIGTALLLYALRTWVPGSRWETYIAVIAGFTIGAIWSEAAHVHAAHRSQYPRASRWL